MTSELPNIIAAGTAAKKNGSEAAAKDLLEVKPPEGLATIGYWDEIETLAARYRHEAIGKAREENISWDQIGAVLGINGVNARQRWMRSRPRD